MGKNSRQSFLHGAVILTVSLVIVKILGLIYKIPLTGIIGGVGMGYYNTAFMLSSPVFALAISGFPTAVSKMISEQAALGRYRDVKKTFRLSMLLYLFTGSLGTVVILAVSGFFVNVIKNPESYWSVMAIGPVVLFGCIIAAYRGYYEGLCDMRPTAVSQVIETAAKLILGLGLAIGAIELAKAEFASNGMVFFEHVSSEAEAVSVAIPYAAAASILGVTLSNLVGMIYLIIRYRTSDGIYPEEIKQAPRPDRFRTLLKRLILLSLPIGIGGFIINLISLVDLLTIMNRLNYLVDNYAAELRTFYGSAIPADMSLADVPNYLYGCFTGLAVSVYSIIPALAGVFSKSALPNISATWAAGSRIQTERRTLLVMRITAFVIFPCGIVVSVLASPILSALFSSRPAEAAVASPILAIMGIAVIFQGASLLLFSILQAIGYAKLPVRHMIVGGMIKCALNLVLMSIQQVNLNGAAIATLVCYLIVMGLEVSAFVKKTKMQIPIGEILIRPLFAAILCGIAARTFYNISCLTVSSAVALAISLVLSGAFYIILCVCLKIVKKGDLESFKQGKKVAKALEKVGLMR